MKKQFICLTFLTLLLTRGTSLSAQHYTDIKNFETLKAFFNYQPNRPILISGHRGGMNTGYPENCIASFENTLHSVPAFFEIDPRFTKDSVIVLMHDATIDRTTTGKGKLSDYTYEELKAFRLVDREGNKTPYSIPTLKECIEWSQGKTILNLDIKDVPLEKMVEFLKTEDAPNIMLTVHKPEQARYLLHELPEIMLSCWCKNKDEFMAYQKAKIPTSQMMAYVGPQLKDELVSFYDLLHQNGIMYMISVAPTHDKATSENDKIKGYNKEISTQPDIIETDYPYLFKSLILIK